MRSPWMLLAGVEALALVALLVLWPPADTATPDPRPADPPSEGSGIEPGAGSPALGGSPRPASPPSGDAVERSEIRNGADSRFDAADPLGIVMAGVVTDAEGQPVPDARLWIGVRNGEGFPGKTGEDGRYTIAGLRPGNFDFTLQATGFVTLRESLEIPEAPAMQRRDFSLGSMQSFHVRLETSQGEELYAWLDKATSNRYLVGAINVVATEDVPASFEPTASVSIRNANGQFHGRNYSDPAPADLPTRYSGVLDLSAPLPMFATAVLRHHVLATVPLQEGMDEIVLRIDEQALLGALCTVQLRIVDAATGLPIPGANAALTDRQTGRFGGDPADEDGSLRMEEVRPGLMELAVAAPEYAGHQRLLNLRAGEDLDLGTIRLSKRSPLSLQLIGPDGSPAGSMSLAYFTPVPGDFIHDPQAMGFSTDADGKATLHGVGADRVTILFNGDDTTPRQAFSVLPSGSVDRTVELRLRTGPQVDFEIDNGSAAEARHYVYDEQGLQHGRGLRPGASRFGLAPGRYRLESVLPSGTVLRTTDFAVGTGPSTVQVTLP